MRSVEGYYPGLVMPPTNVKTFIFFRETLQYFLLTQWPSADVMGSNLLIPWIKALSKASMDSLKIRSGQAMTFFKQL